MTILHHRINLLPPHRTAVFNLSADLSAGALEKVEALAKAEGPAAAAPISENLTLATDAARSRSIR